jgi:ASC-1-like (ASCH) protein
MKIEKKVQSKYFNSVLEGRKPFEVRLADFKCKEGDTLVLREQKNRTRILTGRKLECEILFKFNIENMKKWHTRKEIDKYGFVVLGIRRKYRYKR